MFPLNVFHAALEEFNSDTIPPILDVTAPNAFCPIPAMIPNPIPLVSVFFKLLTVPIADLKADVNPLSCADNIAFTEKLSAMPSLSFHHSADYV